MYIMRRLILLFVMILCSISINAATRTYHAYVPTYMYSLGTITITYNSSNVDMTFQGTQMHCSVLRILTTDDGYVYLLRNRSNNSYWILAMSSTDGALFKSNSSFSVRDMKMYLSMKRIQR